MVRVGLWLVIIRPQRSLQIFESGVRDGAELLIDGRGVDAEEPNGFYMGPSILIEESEMEIAREEASDLYESNAIDDLEAAIDLANNTPLVTELVSHHQ